jgi:DNA-nicking Smr family endonuclease
MSRKKGGLTDEEQSLWNRITQRIKPLPQGTKRVLPAAASPYRPLRKKPAFSLPPEGPSFTNPLVSHRIQRVRSVEIEARLDLHGLTLANARLRLSKFLITAQENRCIWVLVITGKGKQKSVTEESVEHPPKKTLRDQVPLWLEEAHLQSVVSAYTAAKPQDGGNGALYVRVKRL